MRSICIHQWPVKARLNEGGIACLLHQPQAPRHPRCYASCPCRPAVWSRCHIIYIMYIIYNIYIHNIYIYLYIYILHMYAQRNTSEHFWAPQHATSHQSNEPLAIVKSTAAKTKKNILGCNRALKGAAEDPDALWPFF